MKNWLINIFYSFPVQLIVLHVRNNLLIIFTWLLLSLLMTGTIGDIFGIKYLFLTPEYLGKVNFWSYLILGAAFGAFFMTWNLTTYMLDAFHFPFLATLERPFTKFCLNNMFIPLGFIGIYLYYTVWFQSYNEYWSGLTIFYHCMGFLLGFLLMILSSSIYFHFTNIDILNLKSKLRRPPNLEKGIAPGRRVPDIESIKINENRWRVDTYLNEYFRPRLVRSVAHYESIILLGVFRQNHVNALVVQLFGLVVLISLGFLIDYPVFRIPAGASVFILASVVVAITGAITYWFHQWRLTVFLLLLIFINFLTKHEGFNHKNKAYGLNYNNDLPEYSYNKLEEMASPNVVKEDKATTTAILNNWRKQFGRKKPKMVIFCVSGGGLKAALWSMQVLQQSDKYMEGDLFKHTMLVTGASGGLIGVAYMRELYLQKQMGNPINIYDSKYLTKVSKDLLNSLCFTIVSNDLFLPRVNFEAGGYLYKKDRGYAFEKQLNENTDFVFDKVLADYKLPEQEALIPMMMLTPSIVNDGRRLVISPHGVSYMTIAPIGIEKPGSVEVDAVDFGRFFKDQGSDQLQFATAIRMNATYPYILPNVYLPSQPSIEVMDAGFRDNYGIISATRYIQVFSDWIKRNTSGVVLVQVSGWDKIQDVYSGDHAGVLETMFNPLGIAGQILELQDYEHDTNLSFIYDLLGKDKFEVIRFVYRPRSEQERASMTFHLTNREANDILNAFYLEENQNKLKELRKLVRGE